MRKRLFLSFVTAFVILLSINSLAYIDKSYVSKSQIQQKIDKYVSDLGLSESASSINWYWNAGIEDTPTLKSGLDNYIRTGDKKYIEAHLTHSPCLGIVGRKHDQNVRYNNIKGCVSNEISETDQARQCKGFATYILYYLFGEVHQDSDNFYVFYLQSASDLQIGDHVRIGGHSYVYYGLNASGEIICLQANGNTDYNPCGLNFGRVYNSAGYYSVPSDVIGARIYRYKYINDCSHESFKFVNDTNVICNNCTQNLAYPAVSPLAFYADITVSNKKAPTHATPFGESTIKKRIGNGSSVLITGCTYNAYGNLWYKLADGTWISQKYITSHFHRCHKDGFCDRCTEKLAVASLNYVNYTSKSSKLLVHYAPYGASPKYYVEGTNFTFTAKTVNGYGHVWYQLSDGGWVWVNKLNVTYKNGLVNIKGDTLALNNLACATGVNGSVMFAELYDGMKVKVYESEGLGGWYCVRVGNYVGYCLKQHITITDSTKHIETEKESESEFSVINMLDVLEDLNEHDPSEKEVMAPAKVSVSVLYPTSQEYISKINFEKTNAVLVANIRKSSGSNVSACGIILYDANGNVIKDHRETVTNVPSSMTSFHTWYDINADLGVTLTHSTKYIYQFYTVVNGKTYYGNTYEFTTSSPVVHYTPPTNASVVYPTDKMYLSKFSITDTNAVVVTNIQKDMGSKLTEIGFWLMDENYKFIDKYKQSITNISDSETSFHAWIDISATLGITLTPKTTYKYKFYAVVDTVTFWGDIHSFTTVSSNKQEEAETEIKRESEQQQDVYYKLIFDANGGSCDAAFKKIKFNTKIGTMPTPKRDGYKFLGWYGAKQNGVNIHENMLYNAPFDVTVYAYWEKITEQEATKNRIDMWIGNPKFSLNGKKIAIDAQGTVPLIKNGRTLVPIRAIVEAMGGSVEWDNATKSVKILCNGHTVKVTIDNYMANCDGQFKVLDVPPEIIGGRTMVPVRFVTENLKADVKWDGNTKQVSIFY